MPTNVSNSNGTRTTKYFTDATAELCQKLEVGQGFIVPLLGGTITAKKQCHDCKWYATRFFKDTNKAFVFGVMPENGGIAIKRLADTVEAKPALIVDATVNAAVETPVEN